MTAAPCLICGSVEWMALPDPSPRSMTSDWRIVEEPLARRLCGACGLIRRDPSPNSGDTLYVSGYTLYAHPPGEGREQARQDEYARWIAQGTGRRPRKVLDVGCGNGSLLRALRTYWPDAELLGCDPARESIAQGFGNGLTLWTGTASTIPSDITADLVVAVNVMEHAVEPMAFLTALRDVLEPDGLLVIVCPDGARPGLDLLFVDHIFSFTREHIGTLLSRAGLQRLGASQAPRSIGAFQMSVSRRRDVTVTKPIGAPPRAEDAKRYLGHWRDLDANLQTRLDGSVVCFGAGEAAALLRAYAPRAWASVRSCTIDGAAQGAFGELPIVPLDKVPDDSCVLVAVRPIDQQRVADRLATRFRRVVTWYDLIDESRA